MGIQVFPAASGGVTQKIQEFTSTGTFTTPSNVTAVRVFLVGGGGGGGSAYYTGSTCFGGGGGGGNVKDWQLIPVSPSTSYTVTIGAGGAGSTTNNTTGSNGSTSSFGSLLSAFGGGGGGSVNSNSDELYPRSLGTVGGWPRNGSNCGGGGGGAANSYMPSLNDTAPFPVTVAALTSIGDRTEGGQFPTGVDTFPSFAGIGIKGYGGGGQGGNNANIVSSLWGVSIHGGGTSASNADGTAGTANKGGGGGGGSQNGSTARNGGNGGSGYALIEYWS